MSLNTQGQRFRETDKKSEKESEGKVSDLWQKKIKREDLQAGSETFCDFKVELKILLYVFWSDHEDKKLVY